MNVLRLSYRGTENRSHRFINPRLFASVVQKTSSPIFRPHRYPQLHPSHLHPSCHSRIILPPGHREVPAPGLTFQLVPCRYPFLSRTGRYTEGVLDPGSGVREFPNNPHLRPRPRRISMSFMTNQQLDRLPPWTHQDLTSLLESGQGEGRGAKTEMDTGADRRVRCTLVVETS